MKDLGVTYDETKEPMPAPSSGEKHYPTLYLNSEQCECAGLKGVVAGETYEGKVKCRARRVSSSDDGEETEFSVDLDIVGLEIKADQSDKEAEDREAKMLGYRRPKKKGFPPVKDLT